MFDHHDFDADSIDSLNSAGSSATNAVVSFNLSRTTGLNNIALLQQHHSELVSLELCVQLL